MLTQSCDDSSNSQESKSPHRELMERQARSANLAFVQKVERLRREVEIERRRKALIARAKTVGIRIEFSRIDAATISVGLFREEFGLSLDSLEKVIERVSVENSGPIDALSFLASLK